ncbi:universal stress protein [Halostagnicola sp. A-GB9-2]|uniref:universal stress protein n=1 Tax=Halostagnicola sp. A-GB9-2 TaxID=3048066 RepID=UPI0024C01FB6|nr:universal stress protein [Halostagnicola sp. A-GB9-2]MDJ1432866.1 universal stress protein [Halostagnicola sp. A-GB9-2]
MTHHLLAPVDDSDPARAALEYALEHFPDAEITVLHAVDDLAAGYAGQPPAIAGTDAEPEVFDEAKRLAAEYDADLETAVVDGTAGDAILEYAEEESVDGIIMGSKGRSGVSRVLLGSIAEQVTRRATVPVTVVP